MFTQRRTSSLDINDGHGGDSCFPKLRAPEIAESCEKRCSATGETASGEVLQYDPLWPFAEDESKSGCAVIALNPVSVCADAGFSIGAVDRVGVGVVVVN